jgi:RHS repeat-associated protein
MNSSRHQFRPLSTSTAPVTFKYDPVGRRIYKSSSSGTSIYTYDWNNLIEETNSGGAVVARYSQTEDVDEPLAELRSGGTSYYEADGLGSITSLTSSAGTVANTYRYDSFGNVVNSTGTLSNPFQYTAREFDTETNLYFYRARYYDSATGTFISEDPLGFAGGRNDYDYVSNNSTASADPSGLEQKKCCADQNFSFSEGSGNFSAPDLQDLVETSVGEAGNTYVPGEVEAIMSTIVNRLDYNLAYASASAATGVKYPFPFNGGGTLTGILQAGYDA